MTTSSGYQCATTPCRILVRRKDHFAATLTLPGYEPKTVQVTPQVSAQGGLAFLGNAMIGGVLGAGIDLYTGAMLDPSPNGQTVALTRYDAAAQTEPPPDVAQVALTSTDLPQASAPQPGGAQMTSESDDSVADEASCSPEKRLYAMTVGVPCTSLGRRVELRSYDIQAVD